VLRNSKVCMVAVLFCIYFFRGPKSLCPVILTCPIITVSKNYSIEYYMVGIDLKCCGLKDFISYTPFRDPVLRLFVGSSVNVIALIFYRSGSY
jgi:hypothetical protein